MLTNNNNNNNNNDNNSSHLLNIMDIYGLTQLITEPTRVTQYSRTLIDLCLTNSPDKICNSGVVNNGISDHCVIFLTRKISHFRSFVHKTAEVRQLKNFNENEFHVIFVWMNGTAFPCSITQMKCGNFGNTFWWVLLISTHHWKQKELETKDLHGLQMSCYAKFTKEIF